MKTLTFKELVTYYDLFIGKLLIFKRTELFGEIGMVIGHDVDKKIFDKHACYDESGIPKLTIPSTLFGLCILLRGDSQSECWLEPRAHGTAVDFLYKDEIHSFYKFLA